MTEIIAILISAIFFFEFGDEFAFVVKKTAVLKVHQGLLPLNSFTQKLTQGNN
ncbi:MAG: hypothetical protein QF441_16250 [Bacteriovoracaceae bacterium]|jgi:hypothetical protein|nr:hypothetical protein [Bacteriovoracaceae bacterium]|tara:strand:+ start:88 stop:246 length:159 start_codon:yes stop_codon:yes gene_type:complete